MQAAFPASRCGVEARGDQGVPNRVPFIGIDAVEDAPIVVSLVVEDRSQPGAADVRARLDRIGGADRCHQIGIDDAALQHVDSAEVLELGRSEVVPLQPEVVVIRRGILALMTDVVDGQDARRAAQYLVVPMPDLEVGWSQCGLPVMGMHNIGGEADVATKLERRTSKEAKSPRIIPIILHLRIMVDAFAFEIFV